MVAISSFRPFADSPAIALNQLSAKSTWEQCFEKIIYFNSPEPRLASPKTFFVEQEGKPAIAEMAACAAMGGRWRAILNADILCDPRVAQLDDRLDRVKAKCAFSFRIVPGQTEPSDLGMDFFCGLPEVWAAVAANMPRHFLIGRIQFDTWLVSFFGAHWGQSCFDLTPAKLIYHPLHGERVDQHHPGPVNDYYLNHITWPKRALRF